VRCALALAIVLLLTLPGAALAASPFEVVTFGGLGPITQKAYDDLDGDGRSEIILMTGHRVHIYRPKEGGGYGDRPAWTLDLAADALYFDVAQVDANPATREIVLVTPKGVTFHAIRRGVPTPKAEILIAAENLVTRGQEDDVHWRGFLRDIDGDGLADIVLPTASGFALYYQGRDADSKAPGVWPTRPDCVVPMRLRASFSVGEPGLTGFLHGEVGVPDFRIKDFNGDGRNDFAVDDGRSLRIFRADDENRIDTDSSESIDLLPLADAAGNLPHLRIRDLSGDGIPDFVVTHRYEGVTDIFLGGKALEKPALSIRLNGWAFDPRITDLNADGRPDLIIPVTARVGAVAALRLVATGTITVHNHIFLNTGDAENPFPARADVVRSLHLSIRLYVDGTGRVRTAHTLLVELSGDFTGDGRNDLVYYQGSNRLAFYAGVREGLFMEDPYLRVRIPDTDGVENLSSAVRDLDGDGKMDLALSYRSRDRKADRVVLLLTGGGKK